MSSSHCHYFISGECLLSPSMPRKEVVRLMSIGELLMLLALSSSLQLLDIWPFWVWLEEGKPLPLVWMALTDTLRPLLIPFWLGEWGGVMSEVEAECWRGGEGDEGKMGSGVQWAIISEIFESQRFLELCVRKMMTTPFRGPFGE